MLYFCNRRTQHLMRATIIVILFLWFHCGNIFPQSASYHFKHYNINSGLSLNTVMTLFQDSKGFIWIGTKNGLNRFDGYDFKIYRRNRSDRNSGPSNSIIYYITEDRSQTLWIATDKGISLYNPLTERFQDFNAKTENGEGIKNTVHRIFIDQQNRVWIHSSNKVYLYTPANDKLSCLNEKFQPFTSVTPSALYVEDNGTAYISFTKYGILQYNAATDRVSFLCSFEYTPTVMSNYKDNQLLVGTMNRGIWTIDKTTKVKNKLPVDEANHSDIYVRDIRRISEKEYWIASESGIYIIRDNNIQHLTHEEFNDNSLSDNATYAVLRDREGGTWIGSYFGGVDYIPAQYSYFENFYPVAYKNSLNGYRVRKMISDKQGNLWIATEDKGLNYYDVNQRTFTPITPYSSPLKVSFTNIQCLNIKDDELWVGTFTKGIDVLNLKTKQQRHYEKSSAPNSLANNEVFAIYTDRNNTTWIGVTTGVFIYDPKIDGFKVFDKVKAHVSDIDEDSQGNIWFTTYHLGVFRYTPSTQEVKNFRYDMDNPESLCYDRITDVFPDSKGRLWFASEDGGFCRFNKENETFTSITTEQGLPSNVIYKMQEDDSHYLWLSTNNGLVKFNPETMAIESLYNSSNGLQCKQFNYNSGTKTADGTLYFGSINGFVGFNPKSFHLNDKPCRVVLTDLYVFNQRVAVGKEYNILTKAMPYENTIRLNYDQSTFGFNFSALSYSAEENGKYAYHLENIEKKWTYTDNANRVSYNSIPPGDYIFRIKYSKDGHTWDGKETRINIHIIPPFWQTTWAYTFYTLLIIGMLFMLIRTYTRKKRRQMEQQLAHQEQQKKEEIYKAKIEFFTSIAHEIRTPITLIKAPLDYIVHSRPDEKEVQENLATMEQNTDRLLELVNQLLDFRKIESQAFVLSPNITDIQELVSSIYNRFIPVAKHKKLNCKRAYRNLPHSNHSTDSQNNIGQPNRRIKVWCGCLH